MFLYLLCYALLLPSAAIAQDFGTTVIEFGTTVVEFGTTISGPGPTFEPPSSISDTPTPTPTPVDTPATTPLTTPTTSSTTSPSLSPQITTSNTPSTSDVTTSVPTPLMASQTPSNTKDTKKVGPILGGAVGGVAAIIAAIGAFFAAHHLAWLSTSLACILGLFFFKSRRLIVLIDGDLPECQVGFFITTTPELQILKKTNIVWKVHRFGGGERQFVIDIPCWPGHGVTQLCYGLVEDRESSIAVRSAGDAPAILLDDETWKGTDDQKKVKITKLDQLTVADPSGESKNIVVGTINTAAEAFSSNRIQPFMLIENFKSRFALASPNLYLHAFKLRNHKRDGDYGNTVGTPIAGGSEAKVIEEDRITLEDGIRVNQLKPLTTWSITRKKDGGLCIVPVKNSKDDLAVFKKKNKNEWKLGNNARV